MNCRHFLYSSAALAVASSTRLSAVFLPQHHLPEIEPRGSPYIEEVPVPEYQHAPQSAYEAFRDMKFGVRIHWGIYSIWHRGRESWSCLSMSFADRQQYNQLYKSWNPSGFDADRWMDLFAESGMKMFAFTSKHHEGFPMFDTKTRVRQRVNWTAPGGPAIESCDLAYSIMETPSARCGQRAMRGRAASRSIFISRTRIGMTLTSVLMSIIRCRCRLPYNSPALEKRMRRKNYWVIAE